MGSSVSLLSTAALAASLAAGLAASPGPASAAPASAPTILVVGDSLSAAYGIKREEGWVALLEERLAQKGIKAAVVNASVSGETTSGGKSRLAALLAKHKPTHVLIELGANDALRGQSMGAVEKNLADMAGDSKKTGAKVLILGMQIPPNYGGAYAARFGAIFQSVAKSSKAALVPFILAGVADASDPSALFLSDGLHPNAKAQPRILANVWPELAKMLK